MEYRGKVGRPFLYKMSDESKIKTSNKMKGHKLSEETKQRISDGVKRIHKPNIYIERVMAVDLDKINKFKRRGYMNIYIPNLNGKGTGNYMRLHVAIIEQKLGRKLLPGEEVHHWGRDKDNNNPSLLTLVSNRKKHVKLDKAKKNMLNYLTKKGVIK